MWRLWVDTAGDYSQSSALNKVGRYRRTDDALAHCNRSVVTVTVYIPFVFCILGNVPLDPWPNTSISSGTVFGGRITNFSNVHVEIDRNDDRSFGIFCFDV